MPNGYICLFGHIHEKGLVTKNGINVGIDAHNFMPISIEDVDFYANALSIYDENVYTDICK